jgi:hypothetical protein
MANIDDEIRVKTEAFVTDISALVRRMALETVASALGGAGVAAAPAPKAAPAAAAPRARRPPPRAKAAPAKPAAKPAAAPAAKPAVAPVSKAPAAPASKKASAAKRSPGEKRPPIELARLTEKLGEYIKANPGQRMEAIAKSLATPTRELNLPIKKLLGAKKIRSQGQKRATEYFPV